MGYRIGIGYDVHPLARGRKLILGGVNIPSDKGLLGHSDADVLTHAVCDGMLGALGLPDIGAYFPNTDKRYKGISSLKLLKEVDDRISKAGYRINNIDTVIIADKPKILPYRAKIINKLSLILKVPRVRLNVKATTSETIGPIGVKAIAAYAVVLLVK